MKKGIYAGSFDPVTYGHIDVIERAARLVDELIVAVLGNSGKTPLFTVEERKDMLREVTKHIPNVTVQSFGGLTVDFARQQHAQVLIRGLRAIPDFEYELNMAQTNHIIAPEIETVFLMTSLKYSYLSSITVKEVPGMTQISKLLFRPTWRTRSEINLRIIRNHQRRIKL